jgi:hypothetical protein
MPAICWPPAPGRSWTDVPSYHLHFPHQVDAAPTPLPILFSFETDASIDIPPPSATRHLPTALLPPQPYKSCRWLTHHSRSHLVLQLTPSSPLVAPHRAPTPLFTPLHCQPPLAIEPAVGDPGEDHHFPLLFDAAMASFCAQKWPWGRAPMSPFAAAAWSPLWTTKSTMDHRPPVHGTDAPSLPAFLIEK